MSNPITGHRASEHDPARLLGELKRVAVERLGAVPSILFTAVETDLNEALRVATESGDGIGGVQREDLMLLRVLRQRSAIHVMRYREQIARMFDEFAGLAITAPSDVPLGLVSDDELEFQIAGERMADSVSRLFQIPLDLLDRRFRALAGALGAPASSNPVEPVRLGEAFVLAFREADLSDTLQQLLMHQYGQQLAKVLGDLYERLNAELADGGFTVGTAPPKPEAAPTPAPEPAAAEKPAEPAPVAARPAPAPQPVPSGFADLQAQSGQANKEVDLFRVSAQARVNHQHLRDLLHAWRDGGGASPARSPAGGQVEATPGAPAPRGGFDLAGGPAPHAANDGWGGMAGGVAASASPGAQPGGLPPRGVQAAGPQGAGSRRELRVEELVSVVSLLQADVYEPFEQAFARRLPLHEAIREHLQDGARRLGIDPERTRVAQREADAIDLVGLLFEALLGTHALAGGSRRLFARLVMTYVRIALTDENLFVRPGHPAKRLLDAVALSCESNDGASPQDRELMDSAERIVERVVHDFNEDLAILEVAAQELQDLLQQQRRRAEVVERRSAETVHGRERLLQARLQAATALSQRIAERSLTPTIARLLERYWQHHYVQTLLRSGHDSGQAIRARSLADALLALDEAAGRARGGEVADRLLALGPQLVKCLASSGLDESAANEWIAGIARAVAFPDAARRQRPAPATPQLNDDADDTRLLRVVGGTATLEFDPPVAERMRQLRPGDWVRLVDEEGVEGSAKVAWISPLTSRLLLVNRRGVRKLVASPEQLAALVKAQRLFADADELPFDQAMRQVRQQLSEAVARSA